MTKQIDLVVDFETEETKTFYQPKHLRGSAALEALTLGRMLEKKGEDIEAKDFESIADFVANHLYNGQFTREQLIDGIHAPNLTSTLMEQLRSVIRGDDSGEENFTKAKKN